MPSDQENFHHRSHRVIAALNREQVDYLDKVGKDAQFSSGTKLSRSQILSAMVNAIKQFHLTGLGIASTEQFEQRILEALTSRRHASKPHGSNG